VSFKEWITWYANCSGVLYLDHHAERSALFHSPTYQSGYGDQSLSLPVFEAMRLRHDIFADVVALAPLSFGKVPVCFGSEPEQVRGDLVSGNFFAGLGEKALLGRLITLDDERKSAQVAVISHRWWMSRFNGSANILGQTLYVKGVPLSIVGVGPAGFEGADPGQPQMEFWIPLQKNPILGPWGSGHIYESPNYLCLIMIGRLKPGVSSETARAALTPLFRRTLAEASPVSASDRPPSCCSRTSEESKQCGTITRNHCGF